VKTVAIAIPSLHRPDLTARCIQSIQKQTLPAEEWEIVVIENEAAAGQILPDPLPPNTRRIDLPTNEGTTGSINRAVAATESHYILLLNNDVELTPDYVATLIAAMDGSPKLGFATGKLLRATQPTHFDGAGDAMLMAGAAYRLGHLDPDHGQFDQPMPVLAACGAAALYRRVAFVASDGLDADFFAYLDDLDLALRAQLLGYSGIYIPEAVAYHVGSATLSPQPSPEQKLSGAPQQAGRRLAAAAQGALHPRVVEYITRNQLYLLIKNYPRAVFLGLLPRIVVYQCLWALLVVRQGALRPYLRGMRSAFRNRRAMRKKGRELMGRRRIGVNEFFRRLRDSEQQVYDWHQSRPLQEQSVLLKFYFRLFNKP
jgi:GT2 family glycosyltransferase